MSATCTFQGDLAWLRLEGEYTTADVRQTVLDALADPELPANPKFLMDVRQSNALANRSPDDIKNMAAFLGANSSALGGQMAILAPEGLSFGLMRMASVYAESQTLLTKVFQDWDAAIAWLAEDHPRS